jgi:UDP-N-acetylmuramate dehydrogenase
MPQEINSKYSVGSFEIAAQAPLAKLTTFRVGGSADYLALPKTSEQLKAALDWGHSQGLSITLLGAGSNLLISDRGLPGLVICTRALRHSEFDADTGRVVAAAGEPWSSLAWKAARNGLSGFEWTIGIPGTVGGAVVMNAGAHGSETADILIATDVVSLEGTLTTLKPEDLSYRYRTSALQLSSSQPANLQISSSQTSNSQTSNSQTSKSAGHDQRIVTSATFQLSPGHDAALIKAATAADLQARRATQPYHLPNCGSVFRNPPGVDADGIPYGAGRLIQAAGLKGLQIGQAQISTLHANFIVNLGGATASDVLSLIRHTQTVIYERNGVELQTEVKIMGDFELP